MGAVEPETTGATLIERAANNPSLSTDELAVALGRIVLLKFLDGEKVGAAAIAELFKGLATLRTAGGGSDLKAVLRELREEDGEDAPFSGET